jgi:hypothetical protein
MTSARARRLGVLSILVLSATACRRATIAPASPSAAAPATGTVVLPFDLFFPAPSGRLRAERRELAVAGDPAQRARALVDALLDGPTREGLWAPLPNGVEVGTIHLSTAPDRVLYLELRSAAHAAPPVSGSQQELQVVYSFVDTVLLNVPEIRRVVLLWNGSQRESFAGHVDTATALAAREALIDRS